MNALVIRSFLLLCGVMCSINLFAQSNTTAPTNASGAAPGVDLSAEDNYKRISSDVKGWNQQIFSNTQTTNTTKAVPFSDKAAEPNANANLTNYYGNGKGKSAEGEDIGQAGLTRQFDCNKKGDPECDAINLLMNGKLGRTQVRITANDPTLSYARGVYGSSNQTLGDLANASQNCQAHDVTTPASFQTFTCGAQVAQYNDTCQVNHIVEVDQLNKYECTLTNNQISTPSCNKILRVTCDPAAVGCDVGAVQLGGYYGFDTQAMTYSQNRLVMTGTYSQGQTIKNGIFNVTITDLNLIERFFLISSEVDNWAKLIINGVVVASAPYKHYLLGAAGGAFPINGKIDDYSSLPPSVCWWTGRATQCGQPWNTTWVFTGDPNNPLPPQGHGAPADWTPMETLYGPTAWNLDIKPYLKNGQNEFKISLVNGAGPATERFEFDVWQWCPRNCHDNWDNSQCAAFDARVR